MKDYELIHESTMEAVVNYKIKACEITGNNCDKCEALHEYHGEQYCAFDTVVRFIEYANKHRLIK